MQRREREARNAIMKQENNNKSHNPVAIANRFVEKAAMEGKQLDILQLVKLVYLAHGWCLGFTGRPLISTPVEAWKYGPVVPEVYWAFRPQGVVIRGRAMDESNKPCQAELDGEQAEIVDDVYDTYKVLSSFGLSHLTHAKGTPWAETPGRYAPIPDEKIRAYYRKRIEERRK